MAKLNVVIPTTDVEVIGKDGARTKYRKVERAAKAGDVIKITDSDATSYVIEGAFYEVKRLDPYDDPQIIGEDGDEFDAAGVGYEVYEKVAESAEALDPRNKFAKGDKVRLVSGGGTPGLFDYETGGIYTVSDPKHPLGRIEITGGGQRTAYATPEQLEKVSAEEFAEIEKWDAIGRKVGEFNPGDLIKIKRNIAAAGVIPGEFGEVKEVNAGAFGNGVRLTKLNPQGIHAWVEYDDIELIVPVEQRFDREEAA